MAVAETTTTTHPPRKKNASLVAKAHEAQPAPKEHLAHRALKATQENLASASPDVLVQVAPKASKVNRVDPDTTDIPDEMEPKDNKENPETTANLDNPVPVDPQA